MKLFVVLSFAAIVLSHESAHGKCDFEAIFNFGDSNSDTGGASAAFPPQNIPYGMTYFNKPAGRMSDGRLIIDFLAQALGMPFLSPYLQSLNSDFRQGVNFAVTSAAVKRDPCRGASIFSLDLQLKQFHHFKLIVQERNSSGTPLPEPNVFAKALYTIYIGQNDFTSNLTFSFGSQTGLPDLLQQVVLGIANTTQEIYNLGGRTFLVFNLAPVGCYPYVLSESHNTSDIDSSGCSMSCNNVVDDYNSMLKAALEKVRQQMPDAKLILVDTHAVLLQIFRNPTAYGFEKATSACYINVGVQSLCNNPQNYVNWDGIHLTEAANKVVADALLKGGPYFDPPFSFNEHCILG